MGASLMLHGAKSNKSYVQLVAPFMRAESRVNIEIGEPRRSYFIYDRRSGKIWGGPYSTEAKGWKEIANMVRKNGGNLINHSRKL
jgi:hypothetical protein